MNRGGREIRSVVRLIFHTCARSRGAALFRPSRAAPELHETRFATSLSAPALFVREEITALSFVAIFCFRLSRERQREKRVEQVILQIRMIAES